MQSATSTWMRRRQLLLLGVVVLGGCVRLGPDFQPPGEDWVDHWNTPALEHASQRGVYPDTRQWWQIFADPVLDRLIAESGVSNTSL